MNGVSMGLCRNVFPASAIFAAKSSTARFFLVAVHVKTVHHRIIVVHFDEVQCEA
jgi:hypothetical protein